MSPDHIVREDRAVLSLTADEIEQARAFNEQIHAAPHTSESTPGYTITLATSDSESLPLPAELTGLLGRILDVVSRGGTVTVGSIPTEVTTTTAAKMLGISRPTLMKLVREEALRSHKRGSHTRLLSKDVVAYRDTQRTQQSQAFERLRALEDELRIDD